MYREPVSGVFRPKTFLFRRLWQKRGQRFVICGNNPASAPCPFKFVHVAFLAGLAAVGQFRWTVAA
jgi:hypothetical protein